MPNRSRPYAKVVDLTFVLATVLFVLAFELLFFFATEDLAGPIYTVKVIVPVLLFVLAASRGVLFVPNNTLGTRYVVFTGLLLLCALLPTVINLGFGPGFIEWAKYLPRLIFITAVVAYLARSERAAWMIAKGLCVIASLATIQYCALFYHVIQRDLDVLYIFHDQVALGGARGLLGNINSMMYFPSFDMPIPRLTSYWLEPSTASAFMFAAFFLGRALYDAGYNKFWAICGWFAFAGGFACMSNAGYLAIGVALLLPTIVRLHIRLNWFKRVLFFLLGMPLIVLALHGRDYVAHNLSDNDVARAVTGVREAPANPGEFDAFGGRLEMITLVYELISKRPLGTGLFKNSDDIAAPSAPIKWLAMAGLGGFLIVVWRELMLLRSAVVSLRFHPAYRGLVQAWTAVAVQQLSYGEWANGLYLLLAGMVGCMPFWIQAHQRAAQAKAEISQSLMPADTGLSQFAAVG